MQQPNKPAAPGVFEGSPMPDVSHLRPAGAKIPGGAPAQPAARPQQTKEQPTKDMSLGDFVKAAQQNQTQNAPKAAIIPLMCPITVNGRTIDKFEIAMGRMDHFARFENGALNAMQMLCELSGVEEIAVKQLVWDDARRVITAFVLFAVPEPMRAKIDSFAGVQTSISQMPSAPPATPPDMPPLPEETADDTTDDVGPGFDMGA